MFEIGNEINFIVDEARHLNVRYFKPEVIPLFYKLVDNPFYVIEE
jgi:carbonic anhydrase